MGNVRDACDGEHDATLCFPIYFQLQFGIELSPARVNCC